MDARDISVITAKLPNYRLLCSLTQLTEGEFGCSDENCIIILAVVHAFSLLGPLNFFTYHAKPPCAATLL